MLHLLHNLSKTPQFWALPLVKQPWFRILQVNILTLFKVHPLHSFFQYMFQSSKVPCWSHLLFSLSFCVLWRASRRAQIQLGCFHPDEGFVSLGQCHPLAASPSGLVDFPSRILLWSFLYPSAPTNLVLLTYVVKSSGPLHCLSPPFKSSIILMLRLDRILLNYLNSMSATPKDFLDRINT